MARNREIISKTHRQFETSLKEIKERLATLEDDFLVLDNEEKQALHELVQHFDEIGEGHLQNYLDEEHAYTTSSEIISKEYRELFVSLDEEYTQKQTELEHAVLVEDKEFQGIESKLIDLKNEAHNQFVRMIEESNRFIDDEMKVHRDFVEQEQAHFQQLTEEYGSFQNEQSNQLLWTIEQSKNALNDINQQLHEYSKSQKTFMNDSILNVLSTLRNTKSKTSKLFKETTDLYVKQRDRIESLSHQRQKPHSTINQSIIQQFVRQIKEVNSKKTNFERMILKELQESKAIVGHRILEAEEHNNDAELEKYILQYELIRKKAEYLLSKNQSMADLLISKYQSEIKKIKIDSFKRVEEIKLSYRMPVMFFQNSINLYSNFSFYINETFDDLDNLLSDLILYNNALSNRHIDYIENDAKTLEDYRINLLVRISKVCSTLTDFIQRIDDFSKEIITLESRNQLEIAEIRKKMENAEIQGDYDKHLLELENNHFFAIFQHDANVKKIRHEKFRDLEMIRIQKDVSYLRQNHDLFLARVEYLRRVADLEKEMHFTAFERDVKTHLTQNEFARKKHEIAKELDALKIKNENLLLSEDLTSKVLISQEILNERESVGSQEVVDFVHHAQQMIDFQEQETKLVQNALVQDEQSMPFSHYLQFSRERLIQSFEKNFEDKVRLNRQATRIIHDEFEMLGKRISDILIQNLDTIKKNILMVDKSTIDVVKDFFDQHDQFVYQLLHSLENLQALIHQMLKDFSRPDLYSRYTLIFEQSRKQIVYARQRYIEKANRRLDETLLGTLIAYFQSLESLQERLDIVNDEAELSLLEKDVLYIEKARIAKDEVLRKINEEFDRLLAASVKKRSNQRRHSEILSKEAQSIEQAFKNKVSHINSSYLSALKKEKIRQKKLEKHVAKLLQHNEHKVKKDIHLLEVSHDKTQAMRIKLDQKLATVLQDIKNSLDQATFQDLQLIDGLLSSHEESMKQSLLTLEKELSTLPVKLSTTLGELENKKSQIVMERNDLMLQEFTRIEQVKFESHPTYVAKMEEIKKRLPDDYLKLYQDVASAQDEFLNQYLSISKDYQNDFETFANAKNEPKTLIQDPEFLYQPFTKMSDFHHKAVNKTSSAYTDSVEKTKTIKKQVFDEEQKSKQKQDRIINS